MACCLVEASASFLPTNATGLCCRKLKAGGGRGRGSARKERLARTEGAASAHGPGGFCLVPLSPSGSDKTKKLGEILAAP